MLLYRPQEDSEGVLKFKLFQRDQPTPLSDVLPMLENMGLDVLGETPHRIELKDRALSFNSIRCGVSPSTSNPIFSNMGKTSDNGVG